MNNYYSIPYELRSLSHWVCGLEDKTPINPYTGRYADVSNPNTWGTFDIALKALRKYNYNYIGFVFGNDDEYFGVDLDDCMDNQVFVSEFVNTLQSYVEISSSGDGIHIICKGKLPAGARKHGSVEMYSEGRYFICTGNVYNNKYNKIVDCTESIKPLFEKYMPNNVCSGVKTDKTVTAEGNKQVTITGFMHVDDDRLIKLASSSKNGGKFLSLFKGSWNYYYKSQSEADLAFCNLLAYWTGRNEKQMDRIFRRSGLMRPKWDEKHGQQTYGVITIGKAISRCSVIYIPGYRRR